MRAATLEVRLEELGVLRSSSRQRVSKTILIPNRYSAPYIPANGFLLLWIGTNTKTAIRSLFTNRHVWQIQNARADKFVLETT